MKIIIDTDLLTDNVTGISATSEDADFPVENLQNDFTTDLWRAVNGILTAEIRLELSKGSAIELLNTNATSAKITAGVGENYTLEGDNSETTLTWYAGYGLGQTGDIIVIGDYDGDGELDLIVWREDTLANFYIKKSSNDETIVQQWGGTGDIPMCWDYDGDGKMDLAIWRSSDGKLYVTKSSDAEVIASVWGRYSLETGYSLESLSRLPQIFTLSGTNGRLWSDYTSYTGKHFIKIELTASATVYAGIVRAGNVEEFNEISPNNDESSNDYSIEKELNNGADYYRKRNVVRVFSGLSILETRANAWSFKHDIFDAVGPKPLAIRLVQNDNITDDQFILFAKRVSSPKLTHLTNDFTMIYFDLKEVI